MTLRPNKIQNKRGLLIKNRVGTYIECGERKYFNSKYNQWVEYKIHYIFSKKKGLVEIKENEKEIINRYTETLKENQSVKKIIFFLIITLYKINTVILMM